MAMDFFSSKLIPKKHIAYVYDLVLNIIAPGNLVFVSPEIQKIIDDILDESLPKGWRDNPSIVKEILRSFKKGFSYDQKYFPEYYAAYYLPNNLYKIQLMFLELFRLGKISFSEEKLMILDIGSAIGTTAWALQDFYNILINVLKLYGLNEAELPPMEIDSIEKVPNNIEFFNKIRARFQYPVSKVRVNKPELGDVLNGALDKINLKNYDVIFASNVICEFPSDDQQRKFAEKIVNEQKKSSSFILIETAKQSDTMTLKKIQYELSKKKDIHIISPCGKISKHSERCTDCWSFRKEKLRKPKTMELFSLEDKTEEDDEKLKWSYTIIVKEPPVPMRRSTKHLTLNQIAQKGIDEEVSFEAEVVSGKIEVGSDKNPFYYLRICDQSEPVENVILKVPRYFELPKYHFGDIFEIKNAEVEPIDWDKPDSVSTAIVINPLKTTVTNKTGFPEPRGLINFKNIDENNLLYFLKRFFGNKFKNFYPGQFDIISKVLKNENVLGILATGGGKSITFQLPALLKPGVSLVVSPFKSLMDDQVNGLKERFGFDFVDRIHSGMHAEDKQLVFERFRKGYLKILYIAPERLRQKAFQNELINLIKKGININYFTIDEAHCISEDGHDFRPAYARLKERQKELPDVNGKHPPIIALTATASPIVKNDIMNELTLGEKDLCHQIIDRKELSLEVIPLSLNVKTKEYTIRYRENDKEQVFKTYKFSPETMRHDILKYILEVVLPKRFEKFDIRKAPGLIFTIYADPKPVEKSKQLQNDDCREYEGAKWLSEYLNEKGINCEPWYAEPGSWRDDPYHQNREREQQWEVAKVRIQNDFIDGKNNLLTATKGFGVGIDKPNIRYIMHFGFPGSLEEYFQQIGRAGRDRGHSHCILLWDGPTNECKQHLKDRAEARDKIPECFTENSNTQKQEFNQCVYGRQHKCDYAKQIYFIETGYPTKEELLKTIEYLRAKAVENDSYPWIFLKKHYIKDHVVNQLAYNWKAKVNEDLLLEKLYTLKYVLEFSQTYLKLQIKRDVTMEEILNSSNDEIIKEHIAIICKAYPQFLNAPPTGRYINFDIAQYIQRVRREQKREISMDEVVEFFNLLDQRNDITITRNYEEDYGYEIKLNKDYKEKHFDEDADFKKVTDWKSSQYQMLYNMFQYAEFQPFGQKTDKGEQRCRRAHIMTVFGTQSAKLDGTKCNYCDNCGFNNSWEKQASDIVADASQQEIIEQFTEFYLQHSKNNEYIHTNLKNLFNLLQDMLDKNLMKAVEIISIEWLKQIGQQENAATNFVLACINFRKGDKKHFHNRFKIFLEAMGDNIDTLQKSLIFLKNIIGADLYDIYKNHFENEDIKSLLYAKSIFSSNCSEFKDIEIEIGLTIIENLCRKTDKIMDKYEGGTFNG